MGADFIRDGKPTETTAIRDRACDLTWLRSGTANRKKIGLEIDFHSLPNLICWTYGLAESMDIATLDPSYGFA